MNDEPLSEKDFYQQKIVEMAKEIKNTEYLKKIFHYIQVPYNMEKREGI